MGNRTLHLYIDDELVKTAKTKGINLSEEFTEYLKARLFSLNLSSEENHKQKIMDLIEETEQRKLALQKELNNILKEEENKKKEEEKKLLEKQKEDEGWF